ncbi:MAG TPA: cytochrome P450 [Allosphingosinicella sp.]|nr:cytochrome P450 [Allosphingosinicella sp.]
MSVATRVSVPEVAVDPFSDEFLADPYRFHAALRDAGPVFAMPAWGAYGMARHAEVAAALQDWETYCSSRGVGLADFALETPWRPPSLLLEADPPLHDRTRRLMNRVVNLAALKTLRPVWQDRADALVETLVARGRFDAVADLAEVFPLSVFPDAMGLRDDGRSLLLPYAVATFNAFGPRNEHFRRTEAEAREAIAWVAEACRRENLKEGGWGLEVYRAADRGECSAAEAERLVRSLLTAGVDTTVNGIANLMLGFASHPDQWTRLRDDPSLARKAFEESLRWDSTVQIFFRTTTRATEMAGTALPEGAKVILFLGAANRDPLRWTTPDAFDIGRTASGHVGFGFGIHQCLGQMVARQEAEVVLNAMLPRIARIAFGGAPTRRLNNTLHALASLPVRVTPA